MLALVNEGARALADGVAARASDIDVIYVNGYGFPAVARRSAALCGSGGTRRGPRADPIVHREFGKRWQPAPLLVDLVNRGQTFRDFDRSRRE